MTIQFADPWLLVLLALVPAAAFLPRLAGKATRPPGLRYAHNPLIASPVRSWRLSFQYVPRGLRVLILVLVIVALARPQTSEARETISGEGVDIALVLDMSGSMARYGKFGQAKKVALAINSLVRGRYQGDFLQIVGQPKPDPEACRHLVAGIRQNVEGQLVPLDHLSTMFGQLW